MPPISNYHYLKALLNNIPDMAWLKDAEGKFILVNSAVADACGYGVEELIGKTDHDIWPAEAAAKYMADDREVMERGERRTIEEQIVDVRGEARWVETVKTPMYDSEGRIIGTAGIARDITERRRAEVALGEMSLEFATLLDNTTDFVYFKDEKSRFRFCSKSVARICGFDDWRDLVGKHDLDLHPEHLAQAYHEDELQIFREGKPLLDRIEPVHDAKGNEIWLHTNKWPIFSEDRSKIVGVFGIGRDITARKRAEEQIRQLHDDLTAYAAELKGANEGLEAFSYSLTHDLRKPLTVINGYAQAIQLTCGSSLDEECKSFIAEIYEATLRMNGLIDAVLRFSLVTRGELHPELVDLSGMAEKVATELKLAEKERNVVFHIAKGVTAHGDPDLLLVVMENLLGNAWKYTGKQEKALVEFGVRNGSSGAPTYFVRDDGIGFDMTQADQLFVPFKRLDGAAAFKGEGIGLATVERIILRHRGRIWAESKPGRGATFFFQLGRQEADTTTGA